MLAVLAVLMLAAATGSEPMTSVPGSSLTDEGGADSLSGRGVAPLPVLEAEPTYKQTNKRLLINNNNTQKYLQTFNKDI